MIYIDTLGHFGAFWGLIISSICFKGPNQAPIPSFFAPGRRRRKAASAENGSQKRRKRVKGVTVKAMQTKFWWSNWSKIWKTNGKPGIVSALCREGGRSLDWFCAFHSQNCQIQGKNERNPKPHCVQTPRFPLCVSFHQSIDNGCCWWLSSHFLLDYSYQFGGDDTKHHPLIHVVPSIQI